MSKRVTKRGLKRLLKQGKTRKALAHFYGFSIRTVGRYVKKLGLVGVAKKGRRPLPPKPEKIMLKKFRKVWILT